MIAVACLVAAALLLFWPDPPPKASLDERERAARRQPAPKTPRKPSRNRKEGAVNERQK